MNDLQSNELNIIIGKLILLYKNKFVTCNVGYTDICT